MDIALLSDRQLFVRFYANGPLLGVTDGDDYREAREESIALGKEIDRRFGEGAEERLNNYTVGWRFSPPEMLDWAADHTDECVEVARTGDCKNPRGSLLSR